MKNFSHFNAGSLEEAFSLLKDYKGRAVLNAGGTDLLGVLKDGILLDYPEAVINIKTIPGLDIIEKEKEDLKIGALSKLSSIANSIVLKKTYNILVEAAISVGSPEIRNMGTIGGNLCQDIRCWYYRYPHQIGGRVHCLRKGKGACLAIKGDNRYHAILGGKKCFAVCPSDMAIALAALDAKVDIAGSDSKKTVPVSDLYGPMGNVLKANEIVTNIRVPQPPDGSLQKFIKFRLRESIDFAVVSVATLIVMDGDRCSDARILLGAVAPTPYRANDAEEILKGKVLDDSTIRAAADAAVANAKPLSGNAYKVEIIKTLVKRALLG